MAPRCERFKAPPVIAQEVGFIAVVDAFQDRVDGWSSSVVLGFAVKNRIFTGCSTVTGTDVVIAVAVTTPEALLQASVYVVATVIGAAVSV